MAVSTLTVVVIEPSRLALLMACVGGPQLLPASPCATPRSAVTLAAITSRADEEPDMAAATVQLVQNDIVLLVPMWHAPAAQALDNGEPFLSP